MTQTGSWSFFHAAGSGQATGQPFELTAGSYGAASLHVLSFSGREEMNGLYAFDILLALHEAGDVRFEDAALGTPASLALLMSGSAPHIVSGIIASVQAEGPFQRGGTVFRVRLVPRLFLLGKCITSRIFQDMSVVEVVDAVLEQHGVQRVWRLVDRHPKRAYCVQHHERDLAFITRLLAEEGIFFHFEHPGSQLEAAPGVGAEVLVFGDAAEVYAPVNGDEVLAFRPVVPGGAMTIEEHHVSAFRSRSSIEPTQVLLRVFDFTRPSLELQSTAGASELAASSAAGSRAPELRVYEHHGGSEEADVVKVSARTYLEQLRSAAREQEGESWCRRLRPGRVFSLAEHALEQLNRPYVVTRVEHHGIASEAGDSGAPVYKNRFGCVPADVPFRPPRPACVPRQVVETATVVGPEGQEIHTDANGRVKVQFHWDLRGRRDQRSSCWLRVAQPWAGSTWGFQFIPRIGMEVVVTFVGGDLDRPLITGCVYNALNPPSHLLPGEATRSGLRTRTTPGGGGHNELTFDDRREAEQVYLRAQRNLDEVVLADHTSEIGRNRTVKIGGNHATTVLGSQSTTVAGSRTIIVEGPLATTARAERSDVTEGDHVATITGNRTSRVGGASLDEVEGDAVTHVREGYSLRVEADASVHVGSADRPSSADFYAHGDHAVGAGRCIRLRAEDAIILECGESTIEMTKDGVRIESRSVKINGTETATMKGTGPAMTLTDEIEIAAKVINLYGEDSMLSLRKDARLKGAQAVVHGGGAGLGLAGAATLAGSVVKLSAEAGATALLDANANMDGALVKLNCGGSGGSVPAPGGRPRPSSETRERPTKPLRIRLLDPYLSPYRSKRYILVVAGEQFEDVTDGEGNLSAEVPAHAELGSLTLWVGEFPTGERVHWKVRIEDLPPPNTPSGARVRLTNLGYYLGPPVESLDDDLRAAIRQFQIDHGLRPDGLLGELTVAALIRRHGH
ncbi:MAG: type VI secretion system tip protein VgrG [Polyangiaceae bacterium]|nr:type VI secretion system tip protein VgrG [Polyangiaceae bacterium]